MTPAQERMLADVRKGPRVYNYRAAPQIKALEAAGLVDVDWDADLDQIKGRLRWHITVTAKSGPVNPQGQRREAMTKPATTRTHSFAGSDSERQSVGLPGHCERCAEAGHVRAHPRLGCADVGCMRAHGPEYADMPLSPPEGVPAYLDDGELAAAAAASVAQQFGQYLYDANDDPEDEPLPQAANWRSAGNVAVIDLEDGRQLTLTVTVGRSSRPLPGHPVLEGASGYDCNCGDCLAQPGYTPRRAPAKACITVEWRSVYGNQIAYPADDDARRFADLAGTTTLTPAALALIRALGYEITETCEHPS